MKVEFDNGFYKRITKIKDKTLLARVKVAIQNAENAASIHDIPHVKKLEGFKNCYRIRIGDYRIGFELKKDTLNFVTIASRKEIYKIFP